jgi:hypothetical protein
MTGFQYFIYWGLGLTLVLLGLWRFTAGRTAGTLRLTGFLLGAAILVIMAGSLVGIFSLDGVGQCLNETSSRRSKLIVCLFHTQMASK